MEEITAEGLEGNVEYFELLMESDDFNEAWMYSVEED